MTADVIFLSPKRSTADSMKQVTQITFHFGEDWRRFDDDLWQNEPKMGLKWASSDLEIDVKQT